MIYFILFSVIFSFLIYLRIYFKPITVLHVAPDLSMKFVPVRPYRKFFRSINLGRPAGFVPLGCGYYAYYVTSDNSHVTFSDVSLGDDFYVFYRKGLKFRSIDCSDRCFLDIIKKFKGV